MNFASSEIEYADTGYFTKIIEDYLKEAPELRHFYTHPVNHSGFAAAIQARKSFSQNRKLLTKQLTLQYSNVAQVQIVEEQIKSLANSNTFTVCTAHQPNIFTGHLYFIYKILHTIRLAGHLNEKFPAEHFVPVFYMGSEDADLDELGHIYVLGDKYEWKTKQKGAVGRMIIDDAFIEIMTAVKGRLGVEKYGGQLISLLEKAYVKGRSIEHATFFLIHELFGKYGLVVLLPDNAHLKSIMSAIFEDDLFNSTPSAIVEKTVNALSHNYKVQANPRDINLFYLSEGNRERIVLHKDVYKILNTNITFTRNEILEELQSYPERFSPNVILRGLFQEMILPNIAFIGGGGELAYWLELKQLFEHYSVPFPVLILRNSFMVLTSNEVRLLNKLNLSEDKIFKPEVELQAEIVKAQSSLQLSLDKQKTDAQKLFNEIKQISSAVDSTLAVHCEALLKNLTKRIEALEKKMLRAEKNKYEASLRQLSKLKQQLFPKNSLQERVENFMPYYSRWGDSFVGSLLEHSLPFEQRFTILVAGDFENQKSVADPLTLQQKEKLL